jgi:hypothetical protein
MRKAHLLLVAVLLLALPLAACGGEEAAAECNGALEEYNRRVGD